MTEASEAAATSGARRRVAPSIVFYTFLLVQLIAGVAIFCSTRTELYFAAVKTENKETLWDYYDWIPHTAALSNNNATVSKPTTPITATATATATMATKNYHRRLPTLVELTSVPANHECPEDLVAFENIVLPHNVTHDHRRVPKIVHVTAKSRCVTQEIRDHVLKWRFPDHSLFFHDDAAVYKLLEYTTHDRYGTELIQNLSKVVTCITNGATLSDLWRYVVLYHYGGIYTDFDNAPGANYTTDFIRADTDAFFFVEPVGVMSQYYMASSKHHPLLLQFLRVARTGMYRDTNNVMVNNPAKITGPGAVKKGMIEFLAAINITSSGYEPPGIHRGGLGSDAESELPWLQLQQLYDRDDYPREYPTASELKNRTVTIFGDKADAYHYIAPNGLDSKQKKEAWSRMNMTYYQGNAKTFPKHNKISCQQHVSRMETLTATEGSFYYQKSGITDLLPRYEFRRSDNHYVDTNTNETLISWNRK